MMGGRGGHGLRAGMFIGAVSFVFFYLLVATSFNMLVHDQRHAMEVEYEKLPCMHRLKKVWLERD